MPPSFVLPPPLLRAAPVAAPRRTRGRRLRAPRFLFDDAFLTGVLTALSVAGLLVVIVAAT